MALDIMRNRINQICILQDFFCIIKYGPALFWEDKDIIAPGRDHTGIPCQSGQVKAVFRDEMSMNKIRMYFTDYFFYLKVRGRNER